MCIYQRYILQNFYLKFSQLQHNFYYFFTDKYCKAEDLQQLPNNAIRERITSADSAEKNQSLFPWGSQIITTCKELELILCTIFLHLPKNCYKHAVVVFFQRHVNEIYCFLFTYFKR